MPSDFFTRLRDYYSKVAEVLRGEAEAASVFPNTSDIGGSREKVYAEFLKQHAPSKCNVFLGGFLFDDDGNESKQLDIIITTDTAPRFDFHNTDGSGKSFSPVEGTLGVASIKSTLDKKQLFDVLSGFASIPPCKSLDGRHSLLIKISNYDDWPYKILYANDGIQGDTLNSHIVSFYTEHPEIPVNRRPNIIHVAGKYVIFRVTSEMVLKSRIGKPDQEIETGAFILETRNPDVQAMVWVLDNLQRHATASNQIFFDYAAILNNVLLKLVKL